MKVELSALKLCLDCIMMVEDEAEEMKCKGAGSYYEDGCNAVASYISMAPNSNTHLHTASIITEQRPGGPIGNRTSGQMRVEPHV